MSRNHKVRQQQTQNWVYIDIIQKAKHKAERYKKKKIKSFQRNSRTRTEDRPHQVF